MTKTNGQVFAAGRVCTALLAVAIALLLPSAVRGQTADHQSYATNTDAAKSPDSAGQQQPSYPEQKPAYPGEQNPSYPGAPPSKGKLEGTMGPLKFRFYGTLLLNISASDSAEVGQDVTLWPAPAPTIPATRTYCQAALARRTPSLGSAISAS